MKQSLPYNLNQGNKLDSLVESFVSANLIWLYVSECYIGFVIKKPSRQKCGSNQIPNKCVDPSPTLTILS